MSTPYREVAPSVNPSPADTYCVSIYSGYSDFRASSSSSRQPTVRSRGDRGAITQFSPGARRNFLKNIFSLSTLPDLAITLTYPGIYPADSRAWKRHLDNFSSEFRDRFPGSWFFWKLEPQKRGAPHYHLLGSLGVSHDRMGIAILRKFIAETWFLVVGSGDERHLRSGISADFINDSFGKCKRYVCKYVGKSTGSDLPEWARPGRFWGIIGRKKLPASPCCHVLLPKDIFFKLRRLVRKWMRRFPSSARYAIRLKKLPSFFILANHGLLFRLLEGALGFVFPQADSPLVSGVFDLETTPF